MKRMTILTTALLAAGCVSINEGVNMRDPNVIDTRQNITEKCPVQVYPSQLIRMQGSGGSKVVLEGGRTVADQAGFDQAWADLTLEPGQTLKLATQDGSKPLIDWNLQMASFFPFKIENSCQRIVPLGMETDCIKVSFVFSGFSYIKDCAPGVRYPVFVYVFPKTGLPGEIRWADDADKDGFSNESELKVGTDPLDANSKP